jgi:hypothetical protein
MIGAGRDLVQVGDRIDAGDLGRFDEGVEDRGHLGAARGLRSEVIAPSEHRASRARFRRVNVWRRYMIESADLRAAQKSLLLRSRIEYGRRGVISRR